MRRRCPQRHPARMCIDYIHRTGKARLIGERKRQMADNRYTTRQDAEEALDYELANSCDGYPNDYDVEAIQDAVIKSDTTEGGQYFFYIEDDYDAFWKAITDNIK